ncbi:protein Daple-like [Ruditapes philippinarum]|uniref:protein Daple-like n=1 Tax=Ruditapes philippinarum TaxID=129788 RepID=UPI00295B881E|nr:protein Daple-like [Ruditapes philippinarum]
MTTSYSHYPPPIKKFGDGSTFDKAAYAAYEAVKSERDALKEIEKTSKRRIEALEKETADLLSSYQGIYDENRVLRSKVEHGPNAQKIRNFRNEIKRLEEKVSAQRTENNMLSEEIASLQKQFNIISEEKKRIDDAFKMERSLHIEKTTNAEEENKDLYAKIERLERQQEEYERRVKNYDEESEGLLSRYKELKRDNLKMETKFKKQKDMAEEEIRETKELNKEMAKEIIVLKTRQAKLQAEFNSVKLDYQAAEKQIDYQNKELDVFRTQSQLLHRNVKISEREYNSMKEELQSVEEMLVDARNFGFESVIDERRNLKKKERKQFKRIDDLELQVEELTRENNDLEKEANEYRRKMEAAIIERENLLFAETTLKRRIEVLENANIDLDRRTKFMSSKSKTGLVVKMPDENIKNLEKEKASLFAKCRYLETQNRRYARRIKELENGMEIDDFDNENASRLFKSRVTSDHVLHADMPTLSNRDPKSSYRRKAKLPRSLPAPSV